jgi:hypothetical protein
MGSIVQLGSLELVELREAWPNEAINFTPWLAEEANLRSLGELLGLELRLESVEKAVGDFSADILAKDIISERWVLIENQLEQTDHTHLGQILTYAAGLDAQTIVWIARSFRDPHRAAIDYLNRISAEDHNFFAVQIELYRIGDSNFAPRFNIVAKPNSWSKNIASSATGGASSSAKQDDWVTYWKGFLPIATKQGFPVSDRTPPREGWFRLKQMAAGDNYSTLYAHRSGSKVRVVLWIQGSYSEDLMKYFEQFGDVISQKIDRDLHWDPMPGKKSSMIYCETTAENFTDLPSEYEWMADLGRQFEVAFRPYFDKLRVSKFVPGADISGK